MPSFANAPMINISTKNAISTTAIYDPTLSFDRANDHGNKRNKGDPNYALDVGKFLSELKKEDIIKLAKITLAGRPVNDGVGMWDIFFNIAGHRAVKACLLTAQADYTPIPTSRVTSNLQFLTNGRPIARTHLNQLIPGDTIAIAINSPVDGFTYVILYRLDDACMVRVPVTDSPLNSTMVTGANLTLEHVLQLDHIDPTQAGVLDTTDKPYDHEKAGALVAFLVDAVSDIYNASAWKPRFLPEIMSVNRSQVESRLAENMNQAVSVSFDEFEYKCKEIYAQAKLNYEEKRESLSKEEKQNKNNKKAQAELTRLYVPKIEVVSVGTKRYVSFGDKENNNAMMVFDVEDMGYSAKKELFLTNQDMVNRNASFVGDEIALPESFGEKAVLRYFTINY